MKQSSSMSTNNAHRSTKTSKDLDDLLKSPHPARKLSVEVSSLVQLSPIKKVKDVGAPALKRVSSQALKKACEVVA